jgi:hypothetical protein
MPKKTNASPTNKSCSESCKNNQPNSDQQQMLQLKVSLQGIAPPIWRRFVVPRSMTLRELHNVLQILFGWTESHLYEFVITVNGKKQHISCEEGEEPYDVFLGSEDDDEDDDWDEDDDDWDEEEDEEEDGDNLSRCYRNNINSEEDGGDDEEDEDDDDFSEIDRDLSFLTRKGMKFTYMYDFGDSWFHEIVVESVNYKYSGKQQAVVLDGARNAPLEDSGGVGGYYEIIASLKDPKNADREYLEWIGDYDPEYFDLEHTNEELARMFPV